MDVAANDSRLIFLPITSSRCKRLAVERQMTMDIPRREMIRCFSSLSLSSLCSLLMQSREDVVTPVQEKQTKDRGYMQRGKDSRETAPVVPRLAVSPRMCHAVSLPVHGRFSCRSVCPCQRELVGQGSDLVTTVPWVP